MLTIAPISAGTREIESTGRRGDGEDENERIFRSGRPNKKSAAPGNKLALSPLLAPGQTFFVRSSEQKMRSRLPRVPRVVALPVPILPASPPPCFLARSSEEGSYES
jgi:hypothetical protein